MEERPDTVGASGERGGHGFWPWLIVLLPVVYVLSIGPVAKMSEAGLIAEATCRVIYAPLIILDRHVPGVEHFLDWYMQMWGVR
jgi:hypothetical protein